MEDFFGKLFVSHLDGANRIPLAYASRSLTFILPILMAMVGISSRWKNLPKAQEPFPERRFLTEETSTILRGIAILFLIFGHLSLKCIEGGLPFPHAGSWAVTIFLYLSGIGLAKTYGLEKIDRKFWIKRLRRLAFPVWLTFLLFYVLDFLLLRKSYDPLLVVIKCLGIITPSPPNPAAWFITYILIFYGVFWMVSWWRSSLAVKCVGLVCISVILAVCSSQAWFKAYFEMGSGYSIVFPTAVLIGLHTEKIHKHLKWLYAASRPVYFGSLFVMVILYYRGSGVFVLALFLSEGAAAEVMEVLRPLYFLGSLTLAGSLLDDLRIRSGLLVLLGNYSFEIFLLHQPFMESYDFFLFRSPLWLFFFLYLGLLVFMSHELRVVSERMKSLAFPSWQEPNTSRGVMSGAGRFRQ